MHDSIPRPWFNWACFAFLVLMLALAYLLGGCALPSLDGDDVPAPNVHVVNSAWQVVREATVGTSKAARIGQDITSTDALEAEVQEYNAAHTDDQWRIIEGEVPPIELAPTADAYIVFADTHEVSSQYMGIERVDLADRRATWRLQVELDSAASGRPCVLYVDNVPPAPTPPEPVDPYVQYACYIVDTTGAIMYEEHPSAADYRRISTLYRLQVELHNAEAPGDPWSFVTGRLWP